MNDEALLEAVLSAYRPESPRGEILPSPEFYDLPPDARARASHEALALRTLERTLDPDQLTSTAKAILARIHAAR